MRESNNPSLPIPLIVFLTHTTHQIAQPSRASETDRAPLRPWSLPWHIRQRSSFQLLAVIRAWLGWEIGRIEHGRWDFGARNARRAPRERSAKDWVQRVHPGRSTWYRDGGRDPRAGGREWVRRCPRSDMIGADHPGGWSGLRSSRLRGITAKQYPFPVRGFIGQSQDHRVVASIVRETVVPILRVTSFSVISTDIRLEREANDK
jgi:hypothetical protein